MKKFAFTLAEVLITLTIIGVIAALTIPNLMRKWEDRQQISAYKKAYTVLDNAYRMVITENGTLDNWLTNDTKELFGIEMAKHLKVKKYCGTAMGCVSYGWNKNGTKVELDEKRPSNAFIKGVDGTFGIDAANDQNAYGKMILDDGMSIRMYPRFTSSGALSYESEIVVDTNGTRGPNKYGYDCFFIGIRQNALTPAGGYQGTLLRNCNPTIPITDSEPRPGHSCGWWIYRKGNMDYKYRDVSAEW